MVKHFNWGHSQVDITFMVIDQMHSHDPCLLKVRESRWIKTWGPDTLGEWTSGSIPFGTCSNTCTICWPQRLCVPNNSIVAMTSFREQTKSIILIHYSLCVSVCESVIFEMWGTEGHSTMLFALIWRASSCELRWLLLELTWCVVREKNISNFLLVARETTPFTLQWCNT